MQPKRLLSISTDRKIFDKDSDVRARQIAYGKDWDEVHIVIFAGKEYREEAIAKNVWVYSTRSVSKFLFPFDAMKLGRFIIERRGISHITCQDASLTALAGLGLKKEIAKQGKEIQLEIQVHEDLSSPYYAHNVINKIRKMLALKYLPQADRVRVVSSTLSAFVKDAAGVRPERIYIQPIFVDTASLKAAPVIVDLRKKYPKFIKIALMASRLESEKNIPLALHAWKRVVETLPTAGLVIVGSGTLEAAIHRQIKELGLSDNVILEPWAKRSDLISYYKTADLFLNTSLFEGYGLSLVEAKSAGLPVISTPVGVAIDIGCTISEFDAIKLSRLILEVLKTSND